MKLATHPANELLRSIQPLQWRRNVWLRGVDFRVRRVRCIVGRVRGRLRRVCLAHARVGSGLRRANFAEC